MRETTEASQKNSRVNWDQGAMPDGYPYAPKELWWRVMQVVKTPPSELTYQKFGRIFGLDFDEGKILWYQGRESKDVFSVNKRAVRDSVNFPFSEIALSKGLPDKDTGARFLDFRIDLFEIIPRLASAQYCIKPERSEIEALGYFYDKTRSEMQPLLDFDAKPRLMLYKEMVFANSQFGPRRPDKEIYLRVLPNGCLVGVSYFAVFK